MKEIMILDKIAGKIYFIRDSRVMLDSDLAELYGVETKYLTRQVRRNMTRFPRDFMLQLTDKEVTNLRCQNVTSRWGGRRYLPCAFTEQGIVMLSTVLHSERAIQMNIAIMRVFVRIKKFLAVNKELTRKLDELEKKVSQHDAYILEIFKTIRQLMEAPSEPPEQPQPPKRRIGFQQSLFLACKTDFRRRQLSLLW